MLAMGLPVLANTGVGDVAEVLRQSRAGIAVDRFGPGAYRTAIDALDRLPLSSEDIRREGRRWFDLEQGIALYDAIYRRLAQGRVEMKERARG
jgi:glycosyltransferase involved in cell wall biosynthesis